MLNFGREVTAHADRVLDREFLVTNGIGGYATGSIGGALTRTYHGLLVAALDAPLGRTVLLAKLDETVLYDDLDYFLFTNELESEGIIPHGYVYLESFRLEGSIPVWTYAVADARIDKAVWMEQGNNTTYIRYTVKRASLPLKMTLKAIVNDQDAHHPCTSITRPFLVEPIDDGLRISVKDSGHSFWLRSDCAEAIPHSIWQRGYFLRAENERGQPAITHHLHAGTFTTSLTAGESVTLVASTDRNASTDGMTAFQRRIARDHALLAQSTLKNPPTWIQQLVLAADQFIVQRSAGDNPDGRSIIAGYHWFGDWGRDTMISLPGLTLVTGRYSEAAQILRTYAAYVDQGMLPNRFPDEGDTPEYNTVDATLWYFNAIQEYLNVTRDTALLRELYPALQEIIVWHRHGTRYGIKMDPADGLLTAGETGVQLTWMDVKIDDWVVTPRTGKAVEINGLWYNALRAMADFSRLLGELDADEYDTLANQVERSFSRFWNEAKGCCYDVIDAPEGNDHRLRPNQLIVAALEHSPLTADQCRSMIEVCSRALLTSIGLRTLAPDHPDYHGDYGGDRYHRDSRYHQGTVWPWLIGVWATAHLRAYGNPSAVLGALEPFRHHLLDACIGSISEVAQGDPPHRPAAAIAQAWSVAEVLRAWSRCQHATSQKD